MSLPATATTADRSLRALYITYDGVLESLGQSQVLPYLRGLAAGGARLWLLSFEKPADWRRLGAGEVNALRQTLASQGIVWEPLIYHKHPTVLATLYDVCRGTLRGWRLARRERLAVVHARSYVAGIMAWTISRLTGSKFLFDMRGFWADERVEARLWAPSGRLYRMAKRWERRLLHDADAVVTLTQTAKAEVERLAGANHHERRLTVIPTCVDLTRFQPRPKLSPRLEALGLGGRFVLMYSGAVGTWYLVDEMARFFRALRQRVANAHFLVLTRQEHAPVRRAIHTAGIQPQCVSVESVPFDEVPSWLALADAAILFRRPAYSLQGVFPTKVGEFLACGVPVVANAGIGDLDGLIDAHRVGIVVPQFSPAAFDQAAGCLLELVKDPDLALRCRRLAETLGTERGIAAYRELYGVLAPQVLPC